jgi:hypothetical protein
MITFVCEKKDVDSEQFPLDSLKILSINVGIKIIIKNYATIVNGVLILKLEKMVH